jgi:uncharacterized membrane protein YeaQ/YmgE (transglycosylase-associated protein family)
VTEGTESPTDHPRGVTSGGWEDNVAILYFILIGLVVGVLARLLLPGRDPVGLIGTILVGIVGAVVGGYLWRELFGDTEDVEWIGAIVMSMILLYVYRRLALGRSGSRTV